MANNKTGFSYHQSDTDRFQDIRIKRLKKTLGGNGYAVYEYILNEIYRVKGCFIEWDEDTVFDVAEYWNLKETLIDEIVNYCCSVGLFSKELLTNERVLTSASIQERFIEMSVRMKRKNPKIPEKYYIIREESNIIQEESMQNSGSLPHSKVKKSKEKEIKVNEIIIPFDSKNFKEKWELWKKYRLEIKKPIKGEISEQAALKNLSKISGHNEQIACDIIDQSISNNWQGLFQLKENKNGKSNSNLREKVHTRMEERLREVD